MILRIIFFISVAIFIDNYLASNTIKSLKSQNIDISKENPLLDKNLDDFSKVKYTKEDKNFIIFLIIFNSAIVILQMISIIIILNLE